MLQFLYMFLSNYAHFSTVQTFKTVIFLENEWLIYIYRHLSLYYKLITFLYNISWLF